MAVAVLLDQHIALDTAYRLTALGFDVVPLRDRGLLGWKDWALMAWCIEQQRAICTRNAGDFERQHENCSDQGESHPGVLIVGELWSQEEIYWALRQYLESNPDPALLTNHVVYLPLATEEFIQERTSSTDS